MPLKVFYLDDERDLTDIFAEAFASPQIQVITENDPEKAVETIRKSPPDLIFLDYQLPNTNAIEVAQKIDPKIPKVLITGNFNVSPMGFARIFGKPFDFPAIRKFLDNFASKKA